MIEESYVSRDTARMLKEAGFEANLKTIYVEEEKDEWAFWESGTKRSDYNYFDDTIACPTQALAARWLREVHNIHIFPNYFFEDGTWFFVSVNLKEPDEVRAIHADIKSYQSAEEAMEAGLQSVLKQIIRETE